MVRRRRRVPSEGEDVQEGLLAEERAAEAAERAEFSGRETPTPAQAQTTTLATTQPSPIENLLHILTKGFAACASSLHAAVQWILSSGGGTQLTPEQLQQLDNMRGTLKDRFDKDNPEHQAALRRLWEACFPDEDFSGSPTRRWTDAGFQGADPSRDFRGGGIYSLLNLIYMSQHYGGVFQRLLHKTDGTRSEIEYPFSVAGINITYRLEELIELRAASGAMITRPPQTPAAASFARLLALESAAFEELYVAAFQVLDSKWLEARASYMQFPMVLDATMDAVRGALAARPESVAALRAKLGLVNV